MIIKKEGAKYGGRSRGIVNMPRFDKSDNRGEKWSEGEENRKINLGERIIE